MTTTESKTRTITLTGRAPVRINDADWPVIASARSWDNEHEFQANRTWRINVRQHEDGRALVYAVHTTQFQGEADRRGGQLLESGADIAAAIERVGSDCDIPESVIRECIADLPPVEI